MVDELIQAMSVEELEVLKETYKDNASITSILEGYIESKTKALEEAKVKAKFEAGIAKLFAKLPHPEDVHNVYVRWAEVEVEDLTVEPEDVEIVLEAAVTDNDGKIITPAVTEIQSRRPTTKEFQWVVQVNHVVRATGGNGGGTQSASKRAITILKHNPDGADKDCGNFASASKACQALGLTIGGDSATRVLTREGYYTKPYNGTDYTA